MTSGSGAPPWAPATRGVRRAGPRVALSTQVELDAGADSRLRAISLDIGLGGICVQVPACAGLESIAGIDVRLGRRILSAPVRRAWQRGSQSGETVMLGLRFLELDDFQTSLLWEALNRRALELSRFFVGTSALRSIDVDIAMDLALKTRRRPFEARQRVYRQGDSEESESSIFIVMHGTLLLETTHRDGGASHVERIGVGDVFGGLPMLLGVPHVDTASCLEESQLLEVDVFSLGDLFAEKPLVARTLERATMERYVSRLHSLVRER